MYFYNFKLIFYVSYKYLLMTQISAQTDGNFERLEEITSELSYVYQEMVASLDELWTNTQNLFEEKMRGLVGACREKLSELQSLKSQTRGYLYEVDQTTEFLAQLKNVIQ